MSFFVTFNFEWNHMFQTIPFNKYSKLYPSDNLKYTTISLQPFFMMLTLKFTLTVNIVTKLKLYNLYWVLFSELWYKKIVVFPCWMTNETKQSVHTLEA